MANEIKGLVNNTTGVEVNDADERYMLRTGIYGGIHVHDNSTDQEIASGSTYIKVTQFTDNEPSSDVTSDAANNKITITKAGNYRISGSFSFSTNPANINVFGTVFLDGVEKDSVHFVRKISNANDIGNAGFTGIIDVTSVPVDLDFRVRHDSGGAIDMLFVYANMNVKFEGST